MPKNAADDIFGYVSMAYEAMFGSPLSINFSGNTVAKAQRPCYEMLQGWNGVNYASPKELLKKDYDKVIYISRNLKAICKAMALRHRQVETSDELLDLILEEHDFFENIKNKKNRIELPESNDSRFHTFSLEDWNTFPHQTFHELLDFLEFPKENRPLLIIAKFCGQNKDECPKACEKRHDFEGYPNNYLPRDYIPDKTIEVIRNRH